MTTDLLHSSGSALRERMIEDMSVRGFTEDTRRDYIRCVKAFAAFIGRSPDTATPEDLRRFQLHQTRAGMRPPGINSAVSALRFFFTVTLDRTLSFIETLCSMACSRVMWTMRMAMRTMRSAWLATGSGRPHTAM